MNGFKTRGFVCALILISGCAVKMSPEEINKLEFENVIAKAQLPNATPEEIYEGAHTAARGYFFGQYRIDKVEGNHTYKTEINEGQQPEIAVRLLNKAADAEYIPAVRSLLACASHFALERLPSCRFTLLKPDSVKARQYLDWLQAAHPESPIYPWIRAHFMRISLLQHCAIDGTAAWKKRWPSIPIPAGAAVPLRGDIPIYYPEITIGQYLKVYRAGKAVGIEKETARIISRCSPFADVLVEGRRKWEGGSCYQSVKYSGGWGRWSRYRLPVSYSADKNQPSRSMSEKCLTGRAGLVYRERMIRYELKATRYSDSNEWRVRQLAAIAAAKGNWADHKKYSNQIANAIDNDRINKEASDTAQAFNARMQANLKASQDAIKREYEQAGLEREARDQAEKKELNRAAQADFLNRVQNMNKVDESDILNQSAGESVRAMQERAQANSLQTASTTQSTQPVQPSSPTSQTTEAQRTSTTPDPGEVARRECIKGGHEWQGTRCIMTWDIQVPGYHTANSGIPKQEAEERPVMVDENGKTVYLDSDSTSTDESIKNTSGTGGGLGPVMQEAIAICWVKNSKWLCHGTTQKLLNGEREISKALQVAGCHIPRRMINWSQRVVHFCGRGLRNSDVDLVAKYNIPTGVLAQRNAYQCAKNSVDHCTTLKL